MSDQHSRPQQSPRSYRVFTEFMQMEKRVGVPHLHTSADDLASANDVTRDLVRPRSRRASWRESRSRISGIPGIRRSAGRRRLKMFRFHVFHFLFCFCFLCFFRVIIQAVFFVIISPFHRRSSPFPYPLASIGSTRFSPVPFQNSAWNTTVLGFYNIKTQYSHVKPSQTKKFPTKPKKTR